MKTKKTRQRTETTRRLTLETLESRQLLAGDAAGAVFSENLVETPQILANDDASWYATAPASLNPSAQEQEFLEQINRFRADPAGELERIFSVANETTLIARNSLVADAISLYQYPRLSIETFLSEWAALSPSAPLAFNASLQKAAKTHNDKMIAADTISHRLPNESDLATRVVAAGFQSGLTNADGAIALSENVGGSMKANGAYSAASFALASFAVDWGVPSHSHRDATANGAYTEIGVAFAETSRRIGPYATTCDLGTSVDGARTDGAYLLGVVYDDADADRFYDAGEGLGAAKITIARLGDDGETLQTVEISSTDAGGYQIFLLNGSYKITVEGAGFSQAVTKNATVVDGKNFKLDFRADEAGAVAPTIDLNGDDADGTGWNAEFSEGASDPLDALAASNLKIVDADSPYLFGAKIVFSSRPDGVEETLDVSVAGTDLRAAFDDAGGSISLTGTGTIAEYEEVIASLAYFNASSLCDLTDRDVSISVYDGVFWSDAAILTISVRPTVLPKMTVEEMVAYEGDEGSTVATFRVALDSPARLGVSFAYRVVVAGGTAVEGESFALPIGDPITIAPGETSAAIECYVLGNFDALKPEGLAAVEGGFENPSTYFYLEIVDVANAYLTNENALVKGTIYDDDSPIILGAVDGYEFASALSTDLGRRRYSFTLTPETSGYFAWSAESLDLPGELSISVRKETLESTPIALSETTEKGQKVQWFADPNVEYWITLECAADFNAIAAKLLPFTDDGVFLVDPLLANADEELLNLFWQDDGCDVEIGDFSWSFDASFFDAGAAVPKFEARTRPNAEVLFFIDGDGAGTVSSNADGSSTWTSDGDGSGASTGVGVVGFSGVTYLGAGRREALRFNGSDGDDRLVYSAGSGYFDTGKFVYRFKNINTVVVDAGSGGNDVALIEDTASNDALRASNDSFGLYGGGYALLAKNFTDVKVSFVNGGVDSYFATDSGDDASAVVAKTASIVSGTFASNGAIPTREYRRVVAKSASTVFSPTDSLGSFVYCADDSSGAYFDAAIGGFSVYDLATNSQTVAYRVKSLKISGVPESAADRFNVATPDGDYSVVESGGFASMTDASGWSLSVPSWKKLATSSSAVRESPGEEPSRADAFVDWSDFFEFDEFNEVGALDDDADRRDDAALSLGEIDEIDVFETLDSLGSNESIFANRRRRTR